MSSTHCVVVWEWQSEGQWLPHTPGVTRTLERAHGKKLTRVVLADADPALKGHYVNLRTLTQCVDSPDGSSVECLVRRALYDAQCPGGRGVRWEWAPLRPPPERADLCYEPMPMEMQGVVEEAWARGAAVGVGSWRVSPARGAAAGPAGLRLLRRAPAPPYPRAPRPSVLPAPPAPLAPPAPPINTVRRVRIPQQHTGSSVQSVQSVQSVKSLPTPAPPVIARNGARSASPPRKHGLARQILHNLNIFSNSNKPSAVSSASSGADGEGETGESGYAGEAGDGGRAGRRHSVDTVSTYLSHESKDSLQQGSVGELLNCSAGSDDVFDSPAHCIDSCADNIPDAVSGLGAGPAPGSGTGGGGGAGSWGAVCPGCMARLRAGPGLLRLPPAHPLRQEDSYMECLICGEEGGGDRERVVERERERVVERETSHDLMVWGPQPSGSMAWSLQPRALPALPSSGAILVTYSFQSGVQSEGHPCPGAPYYAVGFPRHSLLPDDHLGRQIVSLLRSAWAAGSLFGVRASRTTGREHVVTWRPAPPAPPAQAHHYPLEAREARGLLLAVKRALEEHLSGQY